MGSISVYQAAAKALDAAAKTLADSQNKLLEHIFEGGGTGDPTPYLPAWEADRTTMTEVVIPEGVTKIGTNAFYGCSSLTSLTLPNSVTSIGVNAFYNCNDLTSLTIPSSVTEIGNYAFYNCTALTSLTIPEGVTSIKYSAFRNCTALTSLTIPSSVTEIGNYAFMNCPDTCDIHFNKPASEVSAMNYNKWGINSGAVIHCSDGDLTVE